MSRSAKVTVNIGKGLDKKIKGIGDAQIITQEFVENAGPQIVSMMKDLIASGQSPVKGVGRFAGYKNPVSYPGKLKPSRPVNLSLTGSMLSNLSFRLDGKKLEVGILPSAPNKIKTIARVHNTGERADIPQRQFIPFDGQDFTVSIAAKIRSLFKERILFLLKSS